MKKLIAIFLLLTFIAVPVWAKPGDVIGYVYSTDIKAFINNIEVPSYCIDGKTVIIPEDISHCTYHEASRTLSVHSFYPYSLKGGSNTNTLPIGTKIGNIYKTDITTLLLGKEIPCYALNGKIAIAIEDIGYDKEFSPYGGKYTWNNEQRTIHLDFIYSNSSLLHDILRDRNMCMTVTETGEITFGPELGFGTVTSEFFNPETLQLFPITWQGELAGYSFVPEVNGERSAAINYFFPEKIGEIIQNITVKQPTREQWLAFFESQMYYTIDSFETDDYLFLYMYQPGPHGSTQLIQRIDKEGYRIQYEDKFESVSLHGQKRFDNLVIDREKEKVTFRYDINYEIDLKTGEIKAAE